jgi:hypothetical protein
VGVVIAAAVVVPGPGLTAELALESDPPPLPQAATCAAIKKATVRAIENRLILNTDSPLLNKPF